MAKQRTETPIESAPPALDFIFHPRSVAVAGASPPQPGFGGMGSGFVISLQESVRSGVGPAGAEAVAT